MRGKPDQQRFEMLLREHLGSVFKVAAMYARGREERDDLTQEICAQCWRSFAGFDDRRARFSTWMYRVALNVAISHLRTAPSAIWIQLAIGAIGLLATFWFHRWAPQPQRAEFARRLDDSTTGGSLRRAQAALDRLARFENE